MLKSHILTTYRFLARHRMYAAINVLGLSAALSVTILSGLFIRTDLSWDRFHERGGQIYRAYVTMPEASEPKGWTPMALGPALVESVPGVTTAVRTSGQYGLLRTGDALTGAQGLHADPGLFELFSFPLLAGNPASSLQGPDAIVLTRSLAQRLFGTDDVVGRSLTLQRGSDRGDFVVTAVARDVPHASTLQFDWVISFTHQEARGIAGLPWDFGGSTYVQIPDPAAVQQAMAFDLDQHLADHKMTLVNLFDMHLHPQVGDSHPVVLFTFAVPALLALLIAAINYSNLAGAMTLTRAREVGVRKTLGADRGQLVRQSFVDSIMLSLLAVGMATPLTAALLPGLNELVTIPGDFDVQLSMPLTVSTLGGLLGLGLFVGVVAGAWPAWRQSRLQPVTILQGRMRARSGAGRVLMVVQFTVSVVFLTAALVLSRQMSHWHSMGEGYDPQTVVCIPTHASGASDPGQLHESRRQVAAFRTAALALPGVAAVSGSVDFIEGYGTMSVGTGDAAWHAAEIEVDPQFVRTVGLRLVEGEDFDREGLGAEKVALINETMARRLGGQVLGSELDGGHRPRIIGVVQDFYHESPSRPIPPVVLTVRPEGRMATVLVRLSSTDPTGTLTQLHHLWAQLTPDTPFEYRFLQDRLDARLVGLRILTALMQWIAGFLALIACLGVFGMASFAVQRRTREMGVRKVFGASAKQVAITLSAQFTRLVLLAVVLATPLAWQLSELFLNDFSNRVELDAVSYLAGGAIALMLTWGVAGYHTLQAAWVNPVQSLRQE